MFSMNSLATKQQNMRVDIFEQDGKVVVVVGGGGGGGGAQWLLTRKYYV